MAAFNFSQIKSIFFITILCFCFAFMHCIAFSYSNSAFAQTSLTNTESQKNENQEKEENMPSLSQTENTSSSASSEILVSPFEKEILGFQDYCKKDSYLQSFNCQCLSEHYRQLRKQRGPEPSSVEIMKSLNLPACTNKHASTQNQSFVLGEEVPQKYIDDAEQFHNFCNNDARYSVHFDCECLSARYLDFRLNYGFEPPRSSIIMALSNKCPNAEGAAGEAYSECYKQQNLMPLHQPIEDFCSCYANTYSKLRTDLKNPMSSSMRVSLKSRAMSMCTVTQQGVPIRPGAVR